MPKLHVCSTSGLNEIQKMLVFDSGIVVMMVTTISVVGLMMLAKAAGEGILKNQDGCL
jgi:hypothetical protein